MKRLPLTIRQRACIGALLFVGSLTLIIVLPNLLTFVFLLIAGLGGVWMVMSAVAP
jgi:hypothetical protein